MCAQWSPGKDAQVLPWMGQREALSHLTRSMGSPGKQTPKEPSTKKELVILKTQPKQVISDSLSVPPKLLMFNIEISRFCVKGVYYKASIKSDRNMSSRKTEVIILNYHLKDL